MRPARWRRTECSIALACAPREPAIGDDARRDRPAIASSGTGRPSEWAPFWTSTALRSVMPLLGGCRIPGPTPPARPWWVWRDETIPGASRSSIVRWLQRTSGTSSSRLPPNSVILGSYRRSKRSTGQGGPATIPEANGWQGRSRAARAGGGDASAPRRAGVPAGAGPPRGAVGGRAPDGGHRSTVRAGVRGARAGIYRASFRPGSGPLRADLRASCRGDGRDTERSFPVWARLSRPFSDREEEPS